MGRRRSRLTSLVNKVNYTAPRGDGVYTMFFSLDNGEGEEFFRPPELADGEEEGEPPDLLGQQGKLYST